MSAAVCLATAAASPPQVTGATRFADGSFGFSFWYPSSWKVEDAPPTKPDGGDWFRDGRVLRTLHVQPARFKDDQASGVIVQEVFAPTGLTELGAHSTNPVGSDQKYFFNARNHHWMYALLSAGPNRRPPGTIPATPAHVTLGGLPIFGGAARAGGDVIVPLDSAHFLVISSMDVGSGEQYYAALAKTCASTTAKAGRQQSANLEASTIRQAMAQLRALE